MKHTLPKNILMIGNSFNYFFLDELYGMAEAAGLECRITGVVAGGATLKQHAEWLQTQAHPYQVRTCDKNGAHEVYNQSLEDCLSSAAWDVISYQNGGHYYRTGGYPMARAYMEPYLGILVDHCRSRFPDAVHCWHQVWAYAVGYACQNPPFSVDCREDQCSLHLGFRQMALCACEDHALLRIPTGDAWEIARADSRIGDTLCMTDCLHDGEEGGQYLNACVWFEMLFSQSCIANTYRPPYALSEERISALQQAAHTAVSSMQI